jgi:NADPH-dependent 2,4-dienoyl-CoA reductase/sulfur reductase-like enzyme
MPAAEPGRPHPPGTYPVVVVGSGPGALELTYDLGRLGVAHAVISADDAPGGMFRRWPFFQRLLSWTKPYAPVPRGSRAYER